MNKGLVSIIMPVFNREHLIRESLDSILNQTYQNWECVVVDDHSTDNTEKIVHEYTKLDKRIKLFKRPYHKSKGANSCRNYGLEKSTGEYIHWFDSDDIAHPQCLTIGKSELDKSGLSFCRFGRKVFFGDFNKNYLRDPKKVHGLRIIDSSNISSIIQNFIEFNTCNVLWKKKSLGDETFNEGIVYADEWEYYSRLIAAGLIGISINTVLFYGRKHSDSTTYEFHGFNRIRRKSKIKATKIVIENLNEKELLDPSLIKFFLRLGFNLKSKGIIERSLKFSNYSSGRIVSYKLGYRLYPVIRPILKFKARVIRLFS